MQQRHRPKRLKRLCASKWTPCVADDAHVAVDCCVVQWCKHIYATEASIKEIQQAVRVEVDAMCCRVVQCIVKYCSMLQHVCMTETIEKAVYIWVNSDLFAKSRKCHYKSPLSQQTRHNHIRIRPWASNRTGSFLQRALYLYNRSDAHKFWYIEHVIWWWSFPNLTPKSPLYPQKSPLYPRNSPLFSTDPCTSAKDAQHWFTEHVNRRWSPHFGSAFHWAGYTCEPTAFASAIAVSIWRIHIYIYTHIIIYIIYTYTHTYVCKCV